MNRYQKYSQSDKGKARSKRYKNKSKAKVSAQNKAAYLNPKLETCSIKGCVSIGERHHPNYSKAEQIIWLCRKHHLMIHGKVRGNCSKCDNPHHAKGLCNKHYMQMLRSR